MALNETLDIERFATDPDFRDAYRAEKVAPLLDAEGRMLRGKRRLVLVSEPELPPQRLPADFMLQPLIERLHRRRQASRPLLDVVTRTHTFHPSPEGYVAYIHGAKKRTKVPAAPGDVTRDFRQAWHTRDNTLKNVLTYARSAQVRRAALASVLQSRRTDEVLHVSAARHTADAIEDFGASLHDNRPIWRGIPYIGELDADVQHIGYYAAEDPELLRAVTPRLFTLVKIEQATREAFWTERLAVIQAVDGDQRSTDDMAMAAYLNEQVAAFGVTGVPEIV